MKAVFVELPPDEAADLTQKQRKLLADRLKAELRQRGPVKGRKS
jgi:hypothetical protein